ncbi:MAG: cobyrinate a,c-diamide synthase [Nitrospirota bacterium]
MVDAYGMAESAGAVVKGFSEFGIRNAECGVKGENPKFAGVIFNRVASENHYKRLKESVINVPVLGYLPRDLNFEIPHRHLGLTIAEENPIAFASLDKLADAVMTHIDIDTLYKSGNQGIDEKHPHQDRCIRIPHSAFRIAVAYDKAFSFYYEDNLDLLRDAGAEIIRFSPLSDPAIPDAADAVYIGGGYPEFHASALSRNTSMLGSVSAWADAGKPLYAECGGLMYLSQGIRDFDNTLFAMAGVFPFETRMMKKPRLGYREIVLNEDCILGIRGEKYRGHEFHYSEIDEIQLQNADCGMRNEKTERTAHAMRAVLEIYSVRDSHGRETGTEGYRFRNTLASYIHVHFGSSSHMAQQFAAFVKGERTA